MRAAPAIAIVVVGTALCGGALEFLVPAGERQTMGFDEVLATLGAWLFDRFMALAGIMKSR